MAPQLPPFSTLKMYLHPQRAMTANLPGAGSVASVAAALLLASVVDGHAHQQYPVSRQYSLSRDLFGQ